FSSRRRHTRSKRDWSSDVCSSDLEIVWLITLLANQSIYIHNRLNEEKKELLTEDDVELLTSPVEMATFKDAIMEAMFKGTKRHIESEEADTKNEVVE